MYFYALFSIAMIAFRLKALEFLLAGMIFIYVIGTFINTHSIILSSWTHSIILEFAFGMILARLFIKRTTVPTVAAYLSILFGVIIWLIVKPAQSFDLRGFEWGPAAALIVFGAISSLPEEVDRANILSSIFLLIGNASFSLYLTHLFAMRFCSITLNQFRINSQLYAIFYMPIFLVAAICLSLACYRYIETPINRFGHNLASRYAGKYSKHHNSV